MGSKSELDRFELIFGSFVFAGKLGVLQNNISSGLMLTPHITAPPNSRVQGRGIQSSFDYWRVLEARYSSVRVYVCVRINADVSHIFRIFGFS